MGLERIWKKNSIWTVKINRKSHYTLHELHTFNYPPNPLKFYTALQLKNMETSSTLEPTDSLSLNETTERPAALQHFMRTDKALDPKSQIIGPVKLGSSENRIKHWGPKSSSCSIIIHHINKPFEGERSPAHTAQLILVMHTQGWMGPNGQVITPGEAL